MAHESIETVTKHRRVMPSRFGGCARQSQVTLRQQRLVVMLLDVRKLEAIQDTDKLSINTIALNFDRLLVFRQNPLL